MSVSCVQALRVDPILMQHLSWSNFPTLFLWLLWYDIFGVRRLVLLLSRPSCALFFLLHLRCERLTREMGRSFLRCRKSSEILSRDDDKTAKKTLPIMVNVAVWAVARKSININFRLEIISDTQRRHQRSTPSGAFHHKNIKITTTTETNRKRTKTLWIED